MERRDYLFAGVMIVVLIVGGILFLSGNPATGGVIDNPSDPDNYDLSDLKGTPGKVTIYFFWGDGCGYCSKQKPYLEEWKDKYPEVEIMMFETWKNPNNSRLFQEVASVYGIQPRGVPTTFIGEEHWIGFSDSMAIVMEEHIQYCIENGCEGPLDRL